VKKHFLALSLFALSSGALATPLTRYFPDFPLAILEAKDLQESVKATGSFGEETQKLLAVLLNDALKSELGQDVPALLRDVTVKTIIASIKDVAVAAYTVNNNPQVLLSVRLSPGNPIVTSLTNSINEVIRTGEPKLRIREGNFLALSDGTGITLGVGNNLLYLSTNSDLLRSYLKRVNGQNLPVVVNNATYRAALEGTGDGFFKQMINLTSVSQVLGRDNGIPKRFINALKTLNVTASASSIVANGMETKSVTQLNPNGGDAALFKLLTYTPTSLELLKVLPSNAPSAAVIATDTSGWLDYIGTWLPELEFSAKEQTDLLAAFTRLKDRLGNEWAVVGSQNFDTASLASTVGLSSALSGLGSILSPTSETVFYGLTKDGAMSLTDLETAIKTEISKPVEPIVPPTSTKTEPTTTPSAPTTTTTLARIKIGEFDTLQIKSVSSDTATPEFSVYIVNKNNTLMISANRAKLEMYIAAAPLLENPAFAGIAFPSRLSGLSFTAPIRIGRSEIETGINALLKSFDIEASAEDKSLERVIAALSDWLESFYSRTEVNHGYFVAEGTKLISYGKEGFNWNK
jgi:hypothetical protein